MPQAGLGIDTWPHIVAARLPDLSADLACVAGFDGRFRQTTGDWGALLGWTDEQLRSRPLLDFVHDDDAVATRAHLAEARGGGSVSRFQNRFLVADGSTRWLLWTAVGVPDEQAYHAVARVRS